MLFPAIATAVSLVLSVASFAFSAEDPARFVLPRPKEVAPLEGRFVVSPATKVRLAGGVSSEDDFTRSLIERELLAGARGTTVSGTIRLMRIADWRGNARELGPEGYTIDIAKDRIDVRAISARGLYYGAMTLLQMAERSSSGVVTVPSARVRDWPEIRDRMILYDLRYNTVNMAYWKRWIRELSRMKINQLMLFMGDDYVYAKYPYMSSASKLTPAKLRELKRYAKLHHIELVPQLESLGHAEDILKHEPHRDIRLGDNPYSFSPCTERTYSVLADFYRELTEEFDQSTLFHVGGDEVWGFDQDPRCHEDIAARGQEFLYARHMNRLQNLLRPHHRRMAIWGDMLLERPGAEVGLDRDITIFDWHYKEYEKFPSLKYFKNLGFKNIFAAPAVFGHWDVFPEFLVTFQNIPGFTRAALAEDIRSVCVTTWEIHHGGNAENYLYGVAFGGQVMWDPVASDLADFNARFASHWFATRDPEAAAHVDRAFWFPWRANGSSRVTDVPSKGYWQKLHQSGDLLYAHFNSFIGERGDEELKEWRAQSDVLLKNLETARHSMRWLDARAGGKNRVTTEALRTAVLMYGHLARKTQALTGLAIEYRVAHGLDGARAAGVLTRGARDLAKLRADFAGIEAGLRAAIDERNSNPRDLELWKATERSLAEFILRLEGASKDIASGRSAPAPKEIGL